MDRSPRQARTSDRLCGVVAAGHLLTAGAGGDALARGGNAVDAVCAAAFAGAACESIFTGPGAGGFLTIKPPGGAPVILDFFVAVPGLGPDGRRLRPEDLGSFTVPFGGAEQVFHIGPASVAVPGMIAGVGEAAARFGRLPLRDLVESGVRLAREGVEVTETVAHLHAILGDMLTATPEAAAIYAPGGRLLGAGDRIVNPDLADTLDHIGAAGAGVMRDGDLAGALVAHLEATGGLVTAEDLRAYRVIERPPLVISFRDLTLVTNPPPSSGGVLIAAALHALASSPPLADTGAFYLGVARAGRHANRVRAGAVMEALHNEDFLERFWAHLEAGDDGPGQGETRKPVGSTTHVSAVDADGGMASLSMSSGSASGVVVPGTGILLNNMMGEEDLNPGGFGGLEPGIRMTSMMAPTLVLRGDEPRFAVGSAGSNRLRSAILQTVLSLVDAGMDLTDAVRRPRVHPEGDAVDVEGGVPEAAIAALREAGIRLRLWSDRSLFFGGVSVAGYGPDGLDGAGDPRRGGGAVGVTREGEVVSLSSGW